jgi:hypothetical protein
MVPDKKFSDFDLDYSNGLKGENIVDDVVKALCTGSTIEVKTDLRWKETGNIYIETECFYQTSQSWEPSGLSVTKATHWAFVLEDLILIIPTDDLRLVVEVEGSPISTSIEPNPSKGFLIRIDHIVRKYRYGAS